MLLKIARVTLFGSQNTARGPEKKEEFFLPRNETYFGVTMSYGLKHRPVDMVYPTHTNFHSTTHPAARVTAKNGEFLIIIDAKFQLKKGFARSKIYTHKKSKFGRQITHHRVMKRCEEDSF